MSKPIVSVIVPVYNQELFVAAALESAIKQTFTDIEILIADDNSSDLTFKIAKSFEKDPRVKCIRNETNLGISGNVNSLLQSARGKYICFFSGDDIMFPNKIAEQVEYMEKNEKCYILYHDVNVVDALSDRILHKFSTRHPPQEGNFLSLIRHQSFCCGCSVMAKMPTTVLCNTNIRYASDWAHYIDILAKFDGTIRYLDSTLGKYRRHENNITKLEFSSSHEEVMETYNYFCTRFPEHINTIQKGRAEREMTYGVKFMVEGKIFKGILIFVHGIVHSPSAFILFLRNAAKYIKSKML